MLDMMSPVIREADSVSQELLDILLVNIIEPHKVQAIKGNFQVLETIHVL